MLLLLHGSFGEGSDWDEFQKTLESGDECWAPDLYAYPSRNLDDLAEKLLRELDKKASSHGKHVLVAYSLGGRLGLHLLEARPGLFERAVLVGAHPGLKACDEKKKRLLRDKEWARRIREEDWSHLMESWNAQKVFSHEQRSPDRSALEGLREQVADAMENWSLGSQRSFWESLGTWTLPCLFLAGEHDEKFRDISNLLREENPLFSTDSIPGAGHRVLFSHPELLAKRVNLFLRLGS